MRFLNLHLNMSIVILAVFVFGCSHKVNPPLEKIIQKSGYRYENVRMPPKKSAPFVILTFSGGGTRAAAFSFGLMEELKEVKYIGFDGAKHNLLESVEIISSVSGGSFTAAYYALFKEAFFENFPKEVLNRNIEHGLFARVANPVNLVRLMSPDFSRIDLADEYYNEEIFQEKTFADLIGKPRGKVPFIVLNATNISINHRFEFTQPQFDLLCSDLSGVDVSRAVAASSNYPVAFAPLTLKNYKRDCGPLPDWIDKAIIKNQNPKKRIAEATVVKSYRDSDREYVHLLDGGLSDNLGLRGPFRAVTSNTSPWSLLKYINREQLDRLFVIAVNAKPTKHRSWDKKSSPPNIKAVLSVVTGGPMDEVSFDSVEMFSDHFEKIKKQSKTVDSCNKKIVDAVDKCRKYTERKCPDPQKITNPIKTDFTFTELTFDNIKDPHLRVCLQEQPTTLALPEDAVKLLRKASGYLLMKSKSFEAGMKRLDPTWEPVDVVIEPELIEKVCGPRPEDV